VSERSNIEKFTTHILKHYFKKLSVVNKFFSNISIAVFLLKIKDKGNLHNNWSTCEEFSCGSKLNSAVNLLPLSKFSTSALILGVPNAAFEYVKKYKMYLKIKHTNYIFMNVKLQKQRCSKKY